MNYILKVVYPMLCFAAIFGQGYALGKLTGGWLGFPIWMSCIVLTAVFAALSIREFCK